MVVTTRTAPHNGRAVSEPLKNEATGDGLWNFCLHHYSNAEVQQASLALQEEFGGNINLALFLAWVENAGFTFSKESVKELCDEIHESEGLIRRYRLMRRELKPQLTAQSYNKMLNYEMSLEKFQHYEIVKCANQQQWIKSGPSAVVIYCGLFDKKAIDLYPGLVKGLRSFTAAS